LNVHLSAERLASLAARQRHDVRAFDLWLRGHGLLLNFRPKDWEEALALFQRIIEQAPHFSPAYSSLANAHNILHLANPGVLRERQREQQALGYARQAAHLDPIDSRAQLCLGWAYLMAKQYDLGALHHALARELNENDPWTMVSSALGCAFCGDYAQARELSARALGLALTPSPSHWAFQCQLRFLCQDYAGSVAAAEQTNDIQYVMAWKAAALFQLGRRDEAVAELERFYGSVGKSWLGEVPPGREAMTRWLLYGFPISRESDWERLRAGLAGAGAPTEGLQHHGW
jgi:tetratricopeptide (TPR) repeat protein